MAHPQQQKFVEAVRACFPAYFSGTKVLEVGSWIFNDTVRVFFAFCDYVGVDVAQGPGVDLVGSGHEIGLPDATFDIVISCECFEHNPFWRETFMNMLRMLRPGGLFVLTCATTGRGEHGTMRTTPQVSLTASHQGSTYYRNLSRREFERAIALDELFAGHLLTTNRYSKDLYFAGVKSGLTVGPGLAERLAALREAAGRINVNGKLTLTKAIGAQTEWWSKWALTRVVGEKSYHDIRYLAGRRRFTGATTSDDVRSVPKAADR